MAMCEPDIVQTIRHHLMQSDIIIEERTIEQLMKYDINYGESSRNRKRGRTRHVTNQCATATIIIHTLRHLLEVTERLWTCPECRKFDS